MTIKVLITGASVTGNALAWWLGRADADVTVVERAPAFRDGGQNVDVRGVGRAVMREMGLDQAALALGTGEEGTAWVDQDGRIAACFTTDADGGEGPTAEMEILRGDLARLLYEPAREDATYRFGNSITAIDQTNDAADVTFASGAVERYDLVIVAEGAGSTTRDLVFVGENRPRPMNLVVAYFTIPRVADDDRLWRWYHAPGGRSVSLRPDRHGTTRAMLTVQQPPGGEDDWTVERQKAWLRETFADAGWQSERVLDGMETTEDFYFDVLRQVRMPRWSNGRVVLCGDAAWCVTPIGGLGTTLAVTGPRKLADEIARATDLRAALAAYEEAMRPMVAKAQGVPSFATRLANPRSRTGIHILHAVMALVSRPSVRAIAGWLSGGNDVEPYLYRYGNPASAREPRRASTTLIGSPTLIALGAAAAVLVAGAGVAARRRRASGSRPRGDRRRARPGEGR